MSRTANHDDSSRLLVHALEQKKGEQPVPEVVRREGGLEAVICPRLLSQVLKIGIENEDSNRSNFT